MYNKKYNKLKKLEWPFSRFNKQFANIINLLIDCCHATVSSIYLRQLLEYNIRTIVCHVSNRFYIFYSILTFDDEFGRCFYGTGWSCSAASESTSILLVGSCYQQHRIVPFMNHLKMICAMSSLNIMSKHKIRWYGRIMAKYLPENLVIVGSRHPLDTTELLV